MCVWGRARPLPGKVARLGRTRPQLEEENRKISVFSRVLTGVSFHAWRLRCHPQAESYAHQKNEGKRSRLAALHLRKTTVHRLRSEIQTRLSSVWYHDSIRVQIGNNVNAWTNITRDLIGTGAFT